MRHLRCKIVALLLVAAACDHPGASIAYSVQDSVGIQVVTLDARHAAEAFMVDPEPEWRIGDGDGLEFHGIEDVVLLGSGQLVVADGSRQQMVVVTPGSPGSVRWGNRGDGPEEFRDLARLFDLGEGQVGAHDRLRNRFTVWDDGFLWTAMPLPQIGESGAQLLELLPGTAGRVMYLAARAGLPVTPVQGLHRGSGPVVRLHASVLLDSPVRLDTLTTIPGNTTFAAPGGLAGLVPFGATTLLSAGQEGLWIGDTGEEEIILFGDSPDPDPERPLAPHRIVRWLSSESRELREERVDRLWSAVATATPEEHRSMIAMLREATPVPATVPAFGTILVAPSGALWIGAPIPPEVIMLQVPPPPQEWLVVDFGRARVARGTTPDGFRTLQVTRDRFVGVQTDSLGVETVAVYRYSWPTNR